MKVRLIKIRDALANSFWFVPTAMALLAIGTALATVALDAEVGSDWVEEHGWIWSGGADGARTMMATVAGSLITVISIVFSLTITTLAQTATHFGPRILRNFTSDRGVQITLGTFISTFVYCLMVMRTVRSADESSFVPYIAVNLGFLMTLASLGVLIYFIDHISKSIQAENLIAAVGRDFHQALPVLFPKRIGDDDGKSGERPPPPEQWKRAARVTAGSSGYMQRVDESKLIRLAAENDLTLRLIHRPGSFLADGAPIMQVLPPVPLDAEVERELARCIVTGRHRTPHQDGLYPIQQLVEIASHALSPGINEPFTAITCLDWLGACLRGVAMSDEPSAWRYDSEGCLRVIARPLTFDQVAAAAFDQIRISGAENPEVAAKLFEVIAGLAPDLRRVNDCQELIRQARIIGEEIPRIANESDRARVTVLQREALETLENHHQTGN
jgi:uncharacterized membrane protein